MGRLRQWREDHGGFLCTIPRACGWLLFVGKDRSPRSNLMYCEYRLTLLRGESTRADA
jgi:hypothetical protein